MTADEILKELQSLFIITRIEDEYFISDKYKTVFNNLKGPKVTKQAMNQYKEILKELKPAGSWPYEVNVAKGLGRVVLIMDLCEVPLRSESGYLLRSITDDLIKAIDKLIELPDVDADLFITVVKDYYKTQEYPKAFKNFILEGDAILIYKEWEEHNKNSLRQSNPNGTKDTEKWS